MSDTEKPSSATGEKKSPDIPTILSVLAGMTEEQKKQRLAQWAEIRYFTPDEFDSSEVPGSGILMNIEFVKVLDKMRALCGFPFWLNSGVRTDKENKEVGGVDSSEHEEGNGVDIRADTGAKKFAIVGACYAFGIKRWGIGDRFVHVGFSYKKPQNVAWTY